MRKIWKILLTIIIIGAIFLIAFFTFKTFSNRDSNTLDSKVTTEIKYLESNFLNIFNELNNITFENYKLSVTEVKESSSSNETSEEGQGGSGSSSGSSGESSGGSSSGGSSSNSSKKIEEYSLEENGVLTNTNKTIDWKNIKSEVEHIYTSISTITLDMYSLGVNHDKILTFNSDFDTLTTSVKNEDKQQTLDSLVKLYSYLPSYLEDFSKDTNYLNVLKTKYNIFFGYSLLDKSDWTNIAVYNNAAIDEFSKILNNITENKKEVVINKIYVELNEMKNSITIKDREIYLIKYKNILEDLNSL